MFRKRLYDIWSNIDERKLTPHRLNRTKTFQKHFRFMVISICELVIYLSIATELT